MMWLLRRRRSAWAAVEVFCPRFGESVWKAYDQSDAVPEIEANKVHHHFAPEKLS